MSKIGIFLSAVVTSTMFSVEGLDIGRSMLCADDSEGTQVNTCAVFPAVERPKVETAAAAASSMRVVPPAMKRSREVAAAAVVSDASDSREGIGLLEQQESRRLIEDLMNRNRRLEERLSQIEAGEHDELPADRSATVRSDMFVRNGVVEAISNLLTELPAKRYETLVKLIGALQFMSCAEVNSCRGPIEAALHEPQTPRRRKMTQAQAQQLVDVEKRIEDLLFTASSRFRELEGEMVPAEEPAVSLRDLGQRFAAIDTLVRSNQLVDATSPDLAMPIAINSFEDVEHLIQFYKYDEAKVKDQVVGILIRCTGIQDPGTIDTVRSKPVMECLNMLAGAMDRLQTANTHLREVNASLQQQAVDKDTYDYRSSEGTDD